MQSLTAFLLIVFGSEMVQSLVISPRHSFHRTTVNNVPPMSMRLSTALSANGPKRFYGISKPQRQPSSNAGNPIASTSDQQVTLQTPILYSYLSPISNCLTVSTSLTLLQGVKRAISWYGGGISDYPNLCGILYHHRSVDNHTPSFSTHNTCPYTHSLLVMFYNILSHTILSRHSFMQFLLRF